MRHVFWITLFALTMGTGVSNVCAQGPGAESDLISAELRDRSLAVLRDTLARQERWVKVHAAEHLIALSYPQGVYEAFEAERVRHEHEPQYRIGIWRVLARVAASSEARDAWIQKIRLVVVDPVATDHVHAIETLAKLCDRLEDQQLRRAVAEAAEADRPTAPYARWLLAISGGAAERANLIDLLNSANPIVRLVTADSIERLRLQDPAVHLKLIDVAKQEPPSSPAQPYLHSAAWIMAPDETSAMPHREALIALGHRNEHSSRAVAAAALAERGTRANVSTLEGWLNGSSPDEQAAVAAALLRIGRRGAHRLDVLDWSVIGLYFVSMLAIGWYYSYRTKTADDYLLGGRTMKPWTVGLSLFATLCSTITYLSTPGEMIQHGPMYFSMLLAYPLIMVVVGYWLVPYFMRLPVTSAYEILESRLGLGVRLLGASFFLAMRLLWMAVILDVTTTVVMLPLLGLDRSYAPYLCAILGLTTVIYSSMGGLRAVVMTDVIQTFILLGGAMAALGLISWNLGGIGGWWPTTWAPNWDPPSLGFDSTSRMSMASVVLSTFVWYVCTAGSDQMAIQRYLSTRDVKAARRMFDISMLAGAVVSILLAMLGMALLAWFRAHPEMLGEGQSVAHNADQLFPRFIAAGLPDGVSGLVVAGLLAAAMSSLSSGLSSCSAVISVDFVNRFLTRQADAATEVRRARYISWSVGILVVLLSSVVGLVQGTVLDVAYKVVNLLTAPLFGLFFMALFVGHATSFGTFVGAFFGLVTVIAISYWTEITGTTGISFMWAMPLGLLVQIVAGIAASLLPFGVSRPLIGTTSSA